MKQNTLIESQTKRDKQAYCMKFDFRCKKRQKITNSETAISVRKCSIYWYKIEILSYKSKESIFSFLGIYSSLRHFFKKISTGFQKSCSLPFSFSSGLISIQKPLPAHVRKKRLCQRGKITKYLFPCNARSVPSENQRVILLFAGIV